ncbi:hypothetical protein GCM10027341_34930 [Spirosoma knui]
MNRFPLYCLFLIASSSQMQAQDVVYLNDQTNVAGTLSEITPDKVSLRVAKGESTIKFSYGSDKVAAVVNQWGRFLCMNQLQSLTAAERDQRISQFLTGGNSPKYDIIIRAIPSEVIYGNVSYAQGDVVNYTTLDGAASSLPKTDLVGIFYHTGKHELFSDASFLCDKTDLLANEPTGNTPTKTADKIQKPADEPDARPVSTNSNIDEPAQPAVTLTVGNVLQLTEQQYEEYRGQALERVQEFAVMLGVIADKTTDAGQKDKAISQVLKMFKSDASIQVSSMVRGGQANTYKIKDYLIRLKLLPYKNVTLEWSDIQYVQELTQKNDGNYYGKIKGEQRFSGLNNKGEVQYGDITQKDVDVMLTPYKKLKEGANEQKWSVLLGNVGVVATQ